MAADLARTAEHAARRRAQRECLGCAPAGFTWRPGLHLHPPALRTSVADDIVCSCQSVDRHGTRLEDLQWVA